MTTIVQINNLLVLSSYGSVALRLRVMRNDIVTQSYRTAVKSIRGSIDGTAIDT